MKKILIGLCSIVVASACYATTYTNNLVGGTYGFASGKGSKAYVLSGEASVTATSSYAIGDVIKLINIPSNACVLGVVWSTPTAFTNSGTVVYLGDNSSSNQFLNAGDLTAGTSQTFVSTGAKVYDSPNNISAKIGGAASGETGKLRVKAIVMDVR